MIDTDAIREWIEALSVCGRSDTSFMEVQKGEWVAGEDDFEYIKEMANHIDAQAEENKRFREALDHIANDKETPSQPWMEYLHLKRIAREALKTDTEGGHWDCICANPTPSSPSVEGKRKCLFCAREMVYRTALKPHTEKGK